jgi:aminobenzoyl-glutamate transport protein
MKESPEKTNTQKRPLFLRMLDYVEIVGNKLPHPATLFAGLALLVVIISWISHISGTSAQHPVGGETILTKSLLSGEGLRWMYENILNNFLRFPPLGYVLVVMVGIGAAEGSGLFATMIRALVLGAPKRLITAAIVSAGVISGLAVEAGYVILIPLRGYDFSCTWQAPYGRTGSSIYRSKRGFWRQFFYRFHRSYTCRYITIGRTDDYPRYCGESCSKLLFYDRLQFCGHFSRNLDYGKNRGTPSGAL